MSSSPELLTNQSQISAADSLLLQNILDAIPDIIGLQKPDHTMISYNKAGYELLGKTRQDVAGKKCYHLIGRDRPCDQCATSKAVRSRSPASIERHVPELRKWFRITAAPLFDDNENITMIVEQLHDITHSKNTESELCNSENRYRSLTESTSDIVWEMDAEGTITFINQKSLDITGFRPKDMIGNTFLHFMPESELNEAGPALMEKLQCRAAFNCVEIPFEHKNGTVLTLEANGIPFFDDTRLFSGYRGVLRDISTRKELENHRIRSNKLESVGRIAAGIGHDFNNLMQAMSSNIQLALLKEDKDTYLKRMETSVEKASNLARQLLSFSRGGSPVCETASIADIIRDTMDFSLGKAHNIRVKYAVDGPLLSGRVDPGQISQVIQNLAVNAKEAMPNGGTIDIRLNNARLNHGNSLSIAAGDYIKITFRDQGMGIPENSLQNIFEPYFTTKKEGSGIGLATSYSIISKHGGHIHADSVLGKGTVFFIYLPATAEKPPPKPEAVTPPETNASTAHILIMDDEEEIRETLQELLEIQGYTVESTCEGQEAIEKYRQQYDSGKPFDAVILDLTIPEGMGGAEALEKIRQIDPAAKAVMATGYSDNSIVSNYRKTGFSALLRKPFKLAELSETLQSLTAASD